MNIKKISLVVLIFLAGLKIGTSQAFADNDTKAAFEMLKSSQKLNNARIKIAIENKIHKTTPNYKRKKIIVANKYSNSKKTNLVTIQKVVENNKKQGFIMKYEPDHPASNKNGYVKYPVIEELVENADIKEAEQSHAANLSIIKLISDIKNKTLEAL